MKRKTIWLVLAAGVAGLTFYLIRKRTSHKRWARRREEILSRAKRHDHGEFVI